MEKTNINMQISDKAIVHNIGEYIKQQRLLQNKTQVNIAKSAGVNRYTLGKIENGAPISLLSLIQILRALNLLHVLNNLKIDTQPSPLLLAKLDKEKRQRANAKSNSKLETKSKW